MLNCFWNQIDWYNQYRSIDRKGENRMNRDKTWKYTRSSVGEKIEAKIAKLINSFFKISLPVIVALMLLTSCAPGVILEVNPAITQATEIPAGIIEPTISPTPEASNTPENSATNTATVPPTHTATPEASPTPEFTPTPKARTQQQIRAEILAAGVNLDDLASSKDEWTSSHVALDTIQDYIDNLNFGRESEGSVTTVVIGLESVKNLKELDQALLTDGGFKLTSFAKLAYKSVDGNWQIIKVPLTAYDVENNVFWIKDISTRSGSAFDSYENVTILGEDNNFYSPLINYWTAASNSRNYHRGTGSFIKLFTGWPENPRWANNDAALGDPPRYTEEQLIEFRKTGDPSIFGYQDADGYYIWWPIVTFNADMSERANYDHD